MSETEYPEIEIPEPAQFDLDLRTVEGWLALMDLQIGQEVMAIPIGSNGSGFQGELIEMVVGPNGPAVLVIQKIGSPVVSLNWENLVMVTRVVGDAGKTVSVEDLEKLAKEAGIELPDHVRDAAEAQASAQNG